MLKAEDVDLKVEIVNNKMRVECMTTSPEYRYQFCLVKDGEMLDSTPILPSAHTVFWLTNPGNYRGRVIIVDGDQNHINKYSEEFEFEGVYKNLKLKDDNKKGFIYTFIRSIYRVVKEIWKNKSKMIRVAWYDKKVENKDSYLGVIWDYLNPLIQIGTFWLVFGTNDIFGGSNFTINNVHYEYVLWMLCGLIPWFYINNGIVKGAASVFGKSAVVLRTKYPLATIPMGTVLVSLYEHMVMLGILFVFFFSYGQFPTLYWFNLIYYIFYMVMGLSALALITSTLTMIARDFLKLINSLIRLLFYVSAILFVIDSSKLPKIVNLILEVNPIIYVVNGFRGALLYKENFYDHPLQILFFWFVVLILFVIGCNLQQRFKDRFIDLE